MKLLNLDGDLIHEDANAKTTGELIASAIKAEKSLYRADLNSANLRGANLSGANLRGANLRGANLRDADLRDADLRDAYLNSANLRGADLRGANLRGANLRDADLRDAYLNSANLRDAYLRDAYLNSANLRDAYLNSANLRGADLRGANLRGANLRDADLRDAYGLSPSSLPGLSIPVITDIHKRLHAAVTANGCALEMDNWHTCETTHCRAGWVTTLAGESGKMLEYFVGTPVAAWLIYQASDPTIKDMPDFYCENDEAMADIKRLAGVE